MKKIIGYAIIYNNRNSFVIVDGAFYNDKLDLEIMRKEESQRLKKKCFIKKILL